MKKYKNCNFIIIKILFRCSGHNHCRYRVMTDHPEALFWKPANIRIKYACIPGVYSDVNFICFKANFKSRHFSNYLKNLIIAFHNCCIVLLCHYINNYKFGKTEHMVNGVFSNYNYVISIANEQLFVLFFELSADAPFRSATYPSVYKHLVYFVYS